jgi:RNA-directed DNA polymerase
MPGGTPCHPDVLENAYRLCRGKGGAAGVDGEDFQATEAQGVEAWLGELRQELKDKIYRAAPVCHVCAPKANGGRRALGILSISDRVVQTAAVAME